MEVEKVVKEKTKMREMVMETKTRAPPKVLKEDFQRRDEASVLMSGRGCPGSESEPAPARNLNGASLGGGLSSEGILWLAE